MSLALLERLAAPHHARHIPATRQAVVMMDVVVVAQRHAPRLGVRADEVNSVSSFVFGGNREAVGGIALGTAT